MTDQLEFDSDTTDALTRLYESEGMRRRQDTAISAAAPSPGDHVVDLGCGPGFYLKPLADLVGPTGRVTAVEPSPDMRASASSRFGDSGVVSIADGSAFSISLDDETVDVVLSVQVFEYIDDISRALAEVLRVLKPGGRALIWDSDWSTVSCHNSDEQRHRSVMSAWDHHLADANLPRTLAPAMRRAGFSDVSIATHAFTLTDLTPGTMADGVVNVIKSYVAGRPEVGPVVAGAWESDLRDLDSRGEFFFSYLQFLVSATA